MTRDAEDGLRRVSRACRAIARYLAERDVPEDVLTDAVRMRLVEIGDAVKGLPRAVTEVEAGIPWSRIGVLGEHLVRTPLDGSRPIVLDTARADVPALLDAAERLLLQR